MKYLINHCIFNLSISQSCLQWSDKSRDMKETASVPQYSLLSLAKSFTMDKLLLTQQLYICFGLAFTQPSCGVKCPDLLLIISIFHLLY